MVVDVVLVSYLRPVLMVRFRPKRQSSCTKHSDIELAEHPAGGFPWVMVNCVGPQPSAS